MEEMVLDKEELQGGAVMVETPIKEKTTKSKKTAKPVEDAEKPMVSCLRKEKVVVKYLINEKSGIDNPKHPYYGGLADNAYITYTVPMLKNGTYKNPLTNEEKEFLEEYLGLEYNALSIYKKENNYWDNYTVRLSKINTILDLSDAKDYIDYKVLLINTDYVAPSLEALKKARKETYRFVMVSDREVMSDTSNRVSARRACWEEFLKVKDNSDVLRCLIRTLDNKTMSKDTSLEFLQDRIDKLIDRDPKMFLAEITDPCLNTKVLLSNAVDMRVVEKRSEFYYYHGEPLCVAGENSTFSVAARFLNMPRNQEIKFSIEAQLNQN